MFDSDLPLQFNVVVRETKEMRRTSLFKFPDGPDLKKGGKLLEKRNRNKQLKMLWEGFCREKGYKAHLLRVK